MMRNKNIQKATRLLKVLLFTLCCVFSASGYGASQITSTSQIETGRYYRITKGDKLTSYGKTYEIHDTLNASGVNHYLQATGSPYLGDKSGYDLWTFELVDGYTDRYYIKNCDGYYWTSNVSSTVVSSKENIIKCSNTKSNAAIIEISFRKNGVADFCIYQGQNTYYLSRCAGTISVESNYYWERTSSGGIGFIIEIGEVEENGLNFSISTDKKATLLRAKNGSEYKGDISIPGYFKVGDSDYSVNAIGDASFSRCDITSVNFGNDYYYLSIGSYAFYYTPISSIDLSMVSTLSSYCFANCKRLKELVFSNKYLATIPNHCAEGCDSLETVNLSSSVSKIDAYSFAECNKLTTVYCSATTPPTIDNTSFASCPNLKYLFVPDGSVDAYKSAATWSSIPYIYAMTPITEMKLRKKELSMVKLSTESIILDKYPVLKNAAISWESSNPSIASVEANANVGTVTAHSVGTATITARSILKPSVSASCVVTVTPLMVTGLTQGTTSVIRNRATKFKVNILPSEADNKNLKYTSLTPGIAVIDESTGMITGLQVGTVQIMVETTDGSNISETFSVAVDSLLLSKITLPASITLNKNATQQIEASVYPEDADETTLVWTSSAPSIASVDDNGIVTGHSVGTAVVTATAKDGSGVSASCAIYVTDTNGGSWKKATETSLKLEELAGGSQIIIYPYKKDGTANMALSGNMETRELTSTEKAGGGGSIWTLEDAGDGYFYIVNSLGLYWAYQSNKIITSMSLVTRKENAVKVKPIWNSTYSAVSFISEKEDAALNNLNGGNSQYNWYGTSYNGDTNSSFHVYVYNNETKLQTFAFDTTKMTVDKDASSVLKLTYAPADARVSDITLKSSDEKVATISNISRSNGVITMTVMGHRLGTAIITAETSDSSIVAASCMVVVKYPFGTETIEEKVTDVDKLTDGTAIKIYQYDYDGVEEYALSANTTDSVLTSTEKAGSEGNIWILEDAGDGYFYLGNFLGQYLGYALTCSTTSKNEAAKIKPVWNSIFSGVNFQLLNKSYFLDYSQKGNVHWNGSGTQNFFNSTTLHVYIYRKVSKVETLSFGVAKTKLERDSSTVVNLSYAPSDIDIRAITIKSSDESVATVATTEGSDGTIAVTVTGRKAGTVTLTAESTDGSGLTASCIVTVIRNMNPKTTVEKVTSMDQLVAGSTIMIYPYEKDSIASMALSSNTADAVLTSTEKASEGSNMWVLEDADDGYFYLVNNLGQYWAFQKSSSSNVSMTVTTSKSNAVKVKLVWNDKYPGVAFQNAKDNTYLNNLYGYNYRYNWYNGAGSPLTYDTNNTYNVYIYRTSSTLVAVKDLSQLEDGSVVNIYPHDKSIKLYTKNNNLSAEKAPSDNSSNWKLIDAGDGNFYIQNMMGLYWAAADNSSSYKTMTCVSYKSKAAKVTLVWNPSYNGVAFKNSTTGKYINDLYNYGTTFNWWSDLSSALTDDAYSTFDLFVWTDPLTSLTIDNQNVEMVPGESKTIDISYAPEYADGASVSVTSSDENVVCIEKSEANEEGHVVVTLVGKSAGSATITARTTDGSELTANCVVTVTEKVYPVTAIQLSQASATMTTEDMLQLTATVLPDNAFNKTLAWSSCNESVATVTQDGIVSAISAGTAVITAMTTDGTDLSDSCTITVTEKVYPVTGIQLSQYFATMTAEETLQLTATITPDNASNKTLRWTSSNEAVATVTQKGLVQALAAGEAIITATTTDGSNLSATCTVTVEEPQPEEILITSIEMEESITLTEGETYQMQYTILPENATNQTLQWSSVDESIVKVDNYGVVSTVKAGTTTIYATSMDNSGLYAACSVTVVKTGGGDEHGGDDDKGKVWSQVNESNLTNLRNGSVINIYPHGKSVKVYAKGYTLNATEAPEENSSRWKLSDTGDGYFYIQNLDGLYWAATDNINMFATMICTTDKSAAAKVALVWNPAYNGVAFKNSTTGKYLNDLCDYGTTFNWWNDSDEALTGDSYSTFDLKMWTSKETDIHGITSDNDDKAVFYTLSGVKLPARPSQEGIYIRVQDGKSQKIVIRKR